MTASLRHLNCTSTSLHSWTRNELRNSVSAEQTFSTSICRGHQGNNRLGSNPSCYFTNKQQLHGYAEAARPWCWKGVPKHLRTALQAAEIGARPAAERRAWCWEVKDASQSTQGLAEARRTLPPALDRLRALPCQHLSAAIRSRTAHAGAAPRSQLVLKGGVSQRRANKTAAFFQKPNLSAVFSRRGQTALRVRQPQGFAPRGSAGPDRPTPRSSIGRAAGMPSLPHPQPLVTHSPPAPR